VSAVALAAEGIGVRLGGVTVLREVSFAVAPGEVLGIFGPSGAGKSTLFRALAGEEPLTAGRVRLDGVDVTALPLWQRARRGLGYVPQTPSVLWDLTVAENLAAFRLLAPPPRGPVPDPGALLAELGLDGRASVLASALSGGERRRLELGRALSLAPRVLVCDEPFAAIDPLGAEQAGALLRRLARAGAAVILADHHVEAALGLCDRAALLLGGEVAEIAAPADFLGLQLVRQHYSGAGAALQRPARPPM
jgi:lipopolysaccharide export system ATP-binding protein